MGGGWESIYEMIPLVLKGTGIWGHFKNICVFTFFFILIPTSNNEFLIHCPNHKKSKKVKSVEACLKIKLWWMVIRVSLAPTWAVFVGMPGADRRDHGVTPRTGHSVDQAQTAGSLRAAAVGWVPSGHTDDQFRRTVNPGLCRNKLSWTSPPSPQRQSTRDYSESCCDQKAWGLHLPVPSGPSRRNSEGGHDACGQDSQRRLKSVCPAEGEAGRHWIGPGWAA